MPSLGSAATNASPVAITSSWASPSLGALLPRRNGDCVYEVSPQPLGVSHPLFTTTTQPCAFPIPWDATSQANGDQPSTPLTTTAISSTPYFQQQGAMDAATPAAKTASLNGVTSSGPPQKPWSSTPPGMAVIAVLLVLFLVVVAILYWFLVRRPRKKREAANSAGPAILPLPAVPAPPPEQALPRLVEQSALPPALNTGIPFPPAPNNGVTFPPPPNNGVPLPLAPKSEVSPSPHRRKPKRSTKTTNETTKNKVHFHPNGGMTVKQTTRRSQSKHGKHDSGLGESPDHRHRSPQWPHQRAYHSSAPSPTRGRATQRRCELPGEPDLADYRQAAFNAETVNAVHQPRVTRQRSPGGRWPIDPLLARDEGGNLGREVPGGYPPSPPPDGGGGQPAPLVNTRGERRYIEWGIHLTGRLS